MHRDRGAADKKTDPDGCGRREVNDNVQMPHPQTASRRGRSGSEGQAMVEFVLALPFLAVLLFAIVQFGFVLNNWVEVSQAARVGARKASLSRKTTDGVQRGTQAARDSAAHLDQRELAVRVEPSQPWRRGDPVKVRVTYPYQLSILGVVVKSGRLSSEAIGRVQ
jgi:Flp pilus assembly protein TadG